jgi:hypothetical protein
MRSRKDLPDSHVLLVTHHAFIAEAPVAGRDRVRPARALLQLIWLLVPIVGVTLKDGEQDSLFDSTRRIQLF